MTRFYNQGIPTSFKEALTRCREYAEAKHNLSVERIADLMGISAGRLYQLLDGDMPISRVRMFQKICRCNYVTQYLAHGENYMLIKTPTGKKLTDQDFLTFQASFAKAAGQLAEFHQHGSDPALTIALLTEHMANTGWHKANVEKNHQPSLDFEGAA